MKPSILLIYTGGTIGMKKDPETGHLKPFDFAQISEEVPELAKFGYHIESRSFNPIIDSSDVRPEFWVKLAEMIRDQYDRFDGFVVLHGTDTMAYSAAALSFMLENLEKPVIFTGSQLPIGMLRTDGRENLISAIEIASAKAADGHARVPEVCICFDSKLFRGNRTAKLNAEDFGAFSSPNLPPLADAGIHIRFDDALIHRPSEWGRPLKLHTKLGADVAILKIFPGMSRAYVRAVLSAEGLRAVVLETYGSGNAPSLDWFLAELQSAARKGIILVNVTQCPAGSVDMDAYANGAILKEVGVISCHDMTSEAALTKLAVLLGENDDNEVVRRRMLENLSGEISVER